MFPGRAQFLKWDFTVLCPCWTGTGWGNFRIHDGRSYISNLFLSIFVWCFCFFWEKMGGVIRHFTLWVHFSLFAVLTRSKYFRVPFLGVLKNLSFFWTIDASFCSDFDGGRGFPFQILVTTECGCNTTTNLRLSSPHLFHHIWL